MTDDPSEPAELYRHIFSTDFMAFFEKAFEIIGGGKPLRDNWHLHAIADRLSAAEARGHSRQIFSLPPRSTKSRLISVAWPAFRLGQDPTTKFMVISYNETLGKELSGATRRLMTSRFYRELFPATRLTTQSSLFLETDQGGHRRATTIDGAGTGLGADWLIFDDPISGGSAASAAERDRVNRNFDQMFSSRLDDPLAGHMLVASQRLHEDDLTGHLLARGGDWDHTCFPAMATEDIVINLGGGGSHIYRKGEVLHPGRFSLAQLDQQRMLMGDAVFEAQYQQNPVPADGNIIRRDWLRRYARLPSREDAKITISVDTAIKTHAASDYSVATVWLWTGNKHYLIDAWRDRVSFPVLAGKIADLYNHYQANNLLIEDQGSGSGLIEVLQQDQIPAVGRKSKDSKETRLSNVSTYFTSGFVVFPDDAPWLIELERELLGFPNTKHDDQVDSISQYLAWAREREKGSEFSYWFA
jgi:predicted phage terminase large subunit-like protein